MFWAASGPITKSCAQTTQQAIKQFPTIELPANQSLFLYTQERVLPFFNLQSKKSLRIERPVSGELWRNLGAIARRNEWGTSATLPWLASLNERFVAGKVDISGQQTKLTAKDGTVYPVAVGSLLERAFVKFFLFESRKGLYVKNVFAPYGMLFLNYDNHNLREYTLGAFGLLTDKTFPQLCADLQKEKSPEFYSALLETALNGFNSKPSLSPSAQELLHDITGVYIAETFKTLHFGKEVYGAASGSNTLYLAVLQYYFNVGGSIIVNDGEHFSTAFRDCSFFNAEYHARQPVRKRMEMVLSNVIEQRFPGLRSEIAAIASTNDQNLFDQLTTIMESGKNVPKRLSIDLIAALTFAASQTGQKQIINLVEQANGSSLTPKLKEILTLTDSPPKQPYY